MVISIPRDRQCLVLSVFVYWCFRVWQRCPTSIVVSHWPTGVDECWSVWT